MQFLQRVWADIKRGDNIDLYLTAGIAIFVVALNLVGVDVVTDLAPLTLAVLGLLAITMLGNRHRIEALASNLDRSVGISFEEDFPLSLKGDFERAKDLWLVGVTLTTTIKNNYQIIEQKLLKGHYVRVLLVSPTGPGVDIVVARNYAQRDTIQKSADINNSLRLLCLLRETAPANMEIRTISYPLAYGVVGVNPDTSTGVLYLENYPYRVISGALPKFVLRATDNDRWYTFYNKEIHILWEQAIPWDCAGTTN